MRFQVLTQFFWGALVRGHPSDDFTAVVAYCYVWVSQVLNKPRPHPQLFFRTKLLARSVFSLALVRVITFVVLVRLQRLACLDTASRCVVAGIIPWTISSITAVVVAAVVVSCAVIDIIGIIHHIGIIIVVIAAVVAVDSAVVRGAITSVDIVAAINIIVIVAAVVVIIVIGWIVGVDTRVVGPGVCILQVRRKSLPLVLLELIRYKT